MTQMSSFKPWKVVQLELSDGISDLACDSEFQGLFVVFLWHGIPLGDRWLAATQLPTPATQLAHLAVQAIAPAVGDRLLDHGFKAPLPVIYSHATRDQPPSLDALLALANPLQRLQEKVAQIRETTISVIICTRDRPDQLSQCLRSLHSLAHAPHEIIVVDNAPTTDATQHLVAQYPAIRYVLESRPGLSAARNAGIRHATGDLIAFTDDDVMVHPNWLLHLQQGFQDPKVMAVTGLMLPAELETEAQRIFQGDPGLPGWDYRSVLFDDSFFNEMKPLGAPVWKIGAGANMAFRRNVFELVGDFDERLGAGASGCSEDSELWYRILANGWHCRYEPTSVVFHYHRKDIQGLKHQMYQYMRGHVCALLVQFENHRHWGNVRRLLVALPRHYVQQFRVGLRRGFQDKQYTLWAEVSGCFAGVLTYFAQRHAQKQSPSSFKSCELEQA